MEVARNASASIRNLRTLINWRFVVDSAKETHGRAIVSSLSRHSLHQDLAISAIAFQWELVELMDRGSVEAELL